jgi:hypothetical protein
MIAMASGTLIAESLRVGASLQGLRLTVKSITRKGPFPNLPLGQPPIWTFIAFELADAEADVLATQLSACLDRNGGWYCDFRTTHETYIVFPERVFHYPRGDSLGRGEAAAYARSLGIPKPQLDWPE